MELQILDFVDNSWIILEFLDDLENCCRPKRVGQFWTSYWTILNNSGRFWNFHVGRFWNYHVGHCGRFCWTILDNFGIAARNDSGHSGNFLHNSGLILEFLENQDLLRCMIIFPLYTLFYVSKLFNSFSVGVSSLPLGKCIRELEYCDHCGDHCGGNFRVGCQPLLPRDKSPPAISAPLLAVL